MLSVKDGKVVVPLKYHEILSDYIEDFDNLINEVEVKELLIAAYWMDCWEQEGLPTPDTILIKLDELKLPLIFDRPKFIRLNSLSDKTGKSYLTFTQEDLISLLTNERCQTSIQMANRIHRDVYLVIRDFIDLSNGVEYRCFIYEEKLRAIALNDTKDSDINNEELVTRASTLLDQCLYSLPCCDCVMDIWIGINTDLLIEFNSYGYWGQAGSGPFDWITDSAQLYGLLPGVEVRR